MNTTLQREYDILMKSHSVEFSKLYNKALYEASVLAIDYDDAMFLESSNEGETKKGGFGDVIKTLLKKIAQVLGDLITMFTDMFKSKVTTDEFHGSQTGQIRVMHAIDKVDKELDRQILESRKGLKLISKLTGADPQKISDKLDIGAGYVEAIGPSVIKIGVGMAASKAVISAMGKNKTEVEEMASQLEAIADPKKQKASLTIVRKLQGAINAGNKARKDFFAKLKKGGSKKVESED